MSFDVFGDMVPLGDRNPLVGAIQRFKVDPPTDVERAEHRAEVAKITGENPDVRVASIGSVEAGIHDSAVETFYVPKPTEESLAEHRALVEGMSAEEALLKTRIANGREAVRAFFKGRIA